MTSIVEMVRHYQRSIEKSMENPARLMHCIQKLNKLPITVEHLQETGVGRTVNNLRKYDGEVGYASKALVSKWKTMVATEEAENDSHDEEPEGGMETEENCQENDDENDDDQPHDEDEDENQLQIDENVDPAVESSDDYQEQRQTSNTNTIEAHTNENHHKKSSKHSSDRKHKHHSEHKSDKKHSHKDRDRKETSSHRKEKDKSRNRKEEKKSSSSETKTKHHSSSSKTEKSNSSHKSDSHSSKNEKKSESPRENGSHDEKPERHEKKSSSKLHDTSKKSSKKDKDDSGKKRKREIIIDSTMGASFADALGMLDMPSTSTKSKKHLTERPSTSTAQQPSTSSTTTSSSTNKKPSSSSINTKNLMEEPELLMKRPKLDPLPDIVADIPPATVTISNNYKPMPLNQTVMDCVFNQSKPVRQMTDEEALTYSISSNKSRTKVYSGVKTGSKGKVDSLFDLCIHVLQDHIDYLEYTGGVPFDILRPVLERATVEQLMTLEDYNPYLIEDSDSLWEQHCRRRFRGKRPEELESWREMFLRCLDEEQAKFKNLTQNIKLAREKSLPVRKTKLAYVDSVVKPPRSIKSKQMKYGTDTLPTVTPAARVESLKNVGGNSASIGDRRLKIAAELRNSIPTHGPRINPNKKAPLMAKTLISMKKVFKR